MHVVDHLVCFSAFILTLDSASIVLKAQKTSTNNHDVKLRNDLLKVLGINNAGDINGHEKWSSEYLESLYNSLKELPSSVFKSDVTIHGYRPVNSDSSYIGMPTRQYKVATEQLSNDSPDDQVEIVIESCMPCAQSTVSISVCWQGICESDEYRKFKTEGKNSILDVTVLFQNLKEKVSITTISSETEDIFITFDFPDDLMLQAKAILVIHSVAKEKYNGLLKEFLQRKKRQADAPVDPPFEVAEESSPCVRKHWEVDFEELGWSEWIVQPKTFEAYICSGTCFTDDIQINVTMSRHAFVRQLYLEQGKVPSLQNYIPKAQCVPIETEALHTLFVDNLGNVILKRIDEIVAKTCGCL